MSKAVLDFRYKVYIKCLTIGVANTYSQETIKKFNHSSKVYRLNTEPLLFEITCLLFKINKNFPNHSFLFYFYSVRSFPQFKFFLFSFNILKCLNFN